MLKDNKNVCKAFNKCNKYIKDLDYKEFEMVLDALIRFHSIWKMLNNNDYKPQDARDAIEEIEDDLENE